MTLAVVQNKSPLLRELDSREYVLLVPPADLEMVAAELEKVQAETVQVTAERAVHYSSPEWRSHGEAFQAALKDRIVFKCEDIHRRILGAYTMKAEAFKYYREGEGWFRRWFTAQRSNWIKSGGLQFLPDLHHSRVVIFDNGTDSADIFQRAASDLFPYDEELEHSTCPWHATYFNGRPGRATCLDGLRIYVVPNGDEESYAWAQEVCRTCYANGQRKVHLVELDYSTLTRLEHPDWGDDELNDPFISDEWFSAHDAAEFIKIAEATPLWTPGYRVKFKPGNVAVPQFGDELADESNPLVKKIMPKKGVGSLIARRGVGKTFLSLHFAYALARLERFLGHKITENVATIWLAYERPEQIGVRLKALPEAPGAWPFVRLKGLPHLTDGNGAINEPGITKIIAEIDKAKVRLAERFPGVRHGFTVVDTLMMAANYGPGGESPQNTQVAINALGQIADATESFVLSNDHFGKDPTRGARGGTPKEDSPDLLLYAYATGEGNLWVEKVRDLGEGQWGVNFKLETIEAGEDADGDAVTTCRVVFDDDQAKTVAGRAARKITKRNSKAVLKTVRVNLGATATPEAVERAFLEAWGGTPEAARKAFERAIKRAA